MMSCGSAASSRGSSRAPVGSAVQLTLDLDWGPALVASPLAAGIADPPWKDGLPFCDCMTELVRDIACRVPQLAHIEADRIAFSIARARSRSRAGTYAFVVPLRFEGGRETIVHGRRTYRMPAVQVGDRDALYAVYFLAPRFLNLSRQRKLHTIIHELYHMSERFDGDLRRFPGRRWAHGPSKARFDQTVDLLMRMYLHDHGSRWPRVAQFLHYTAREADELFGGVKALSLPRPRPEPV